MSSSIAISKIPPEDGGYRHVLRLVLPLVLSNAAYTLMQFTDRILVSRFSSDSIQAALPASVVSFCLLGFFCSIAGYSSTFAAQYYGAKDIRGAIRSCATGIWLSIFFIPFFLALIPLCNGLISLTGHAPVIQELEKRYALWMLLGGPLVGMQWTLSGFLSAKNRATANALAIAAGCVLNVILDVLFIFGHGRIPAGGLEGAAIATFVSSVFTTLLLLSLTLLDKDVRANKLADQIRPDWNLVRRVLHFGLPSGTQLLLDQGAWAFFIVLTGRLDALSLSASNIAISINNLVFAPMLGFSMAASIVAGQFQGAGKPLQAKSSVFRCLKLGWCYTLTLGLIFILFPATLLDLFRSPDAVYSTGELFRIGRVLLAMMAGWGVFDAMNIVFLSALKGVGDTRFVMIYLLLVEWLFWIPPEILCICVYHGSIINAWTIQLVFIIVLSIGFLIRWQQGKWMSIQMIQR